MAGTEIRSITARQVYTNRGNPGVEAVVTTENGATGRAMCTSGISIGTHEIHFDFDGGERFRGKGVLGAVRNVNEIIAPALKGLDAMYLPVPGVAMVAGHERYGGGITTPGGKPTMSVMCFGFDTFADASYACWDIHTRWAEKMDKRFGGAPNIRDFIVVPEGVFKSDEEIWEAMTETIIEAGYEGRAGFQMDVATDTYHNKEDGKYYGLFNNQPKTKDQLYEFYLHIIKEFPFVILEDPFNEDDYDTTAALTKDSGIQIVGDDLFTTNIRRVAYGVTKGAANTVLLKVNQIGTISEALEMIQYAYKFGYAVMPSDSRGEGEAIADYAVGINAGSVRECGIGPRANRFMEIEAELGKTAKFLGARGLKGFKNQQRADALERKE